MAHGLYPAFVRIEYHSAYAPHIMTIPTLAWDTGPDFDGHFDTHDAGTIAAEEMIQALVDTLAEIYTSGVTFDRWTIYTLDTPTSDPVPQTGATLAVPGTNVSSAWSKAVEQTFVWRTTLAGIFKLVLLDVPTDDNFDNVQTLSGDYTAIGAEIQSPDNAWAGRDGGRPQTFIQASATLNEKLRRSYRMF